MELQHFTHEHKLVLNEKNNLDPDEGISSICFVCNLPIFYTPYYSCSNSHGCGDFFIHQRCADLPKQLKHPLNGFDLLAEVGLDRMSQQFCPQCDRNCGHVAWKFDSECENEDLLRILVKELTFDAACVAPLELRIIHDSHGHQLIPIHRIDSMICRACGLTHENENMPRRSSLFYCCWPCNFWIHERCSTVPNYIQHREHKNHPLALTYALPRDDGTSYCCGICDLLITSLGIYFCGKCSYYAHINCVANSSEHYKSVPSHEIGDQSNYWIQLPMEDEDASLVSHIMDNMKLENHASSSSSSASDKHDHPLIFNATNTNPGRALICDGCIQPINSAPYYSCSYDECTDYLLHECCANLPSSIVPPENDSGCEHNLSLFTKHDIFGFDCYGCKFRTNGFSYGCDICNYELDVQCAFLPKSIMHKAHDKRHILQRQFNPTIPKCCNVGGIELKLYYCTVFNCDFRLHGVCAGLPMSVRHKFDKHPLKLITGCAQTTSDHRDEINFCEFCEKEIDSKYWYYDCALCNNSFHVKCIPAVGRNSKMKLRAGLKLLFHRHPLNSVRLFMTVSRNYTCDVCHKEIPNFKDVLAFECLECDLTFHDRCAQRMYLAYVFA